MPIHFYIALILIVIANIGTLLILITLARRPRAVIYPGLGLTSQIEASDQAARQRQAELIGYIQRTANATGSLVTKEAKKTRRDIQQVKTRLTDDEKDDQRAKAAARRLAKKLEAGADSDIQADSTLPEGTMILRDDETNDEVVVRDVTAGQLVKAARQAVKPQKKRKKSR